MVASVKDGHSGNVVEAPSGASITDPLNEHPCAETLEKLKTSVSTKSGFGFQDARFVVDPEGIIEDRDIPATLKDTGAPLRDTNPKTKFGQAKPPLAIVPGSAMLYMAEALRDGTDKYGQANWRVDPVSSSTYANALERHFQAWKDGEDIDPTSKVPHLAHAMTNIAIILDAMLCGTLIDDRPPPAPLGELIRAFTRPITNDDENPNNG